MKTKLQTNSIIVLIIFFLLAFIVTGILLQFRTEETITKSLSANKQAMASSRIHNYVQNIITDALIIESKTRGFVLSGGTDFLAGVQDTMLQLKQDLAELQQMDTNNRNSGYFADLSGLTDRKIAFINNTLDLYYSKGIPAATQRIASGHGTRLRDSIMTLAVVIETSLQTELESIFRQNNERADAVLQLSRIITFLSIAAILVLCFIIVRRLHSQHSLIRELETAHLMETEARQNVEKISKDIYDLYNNAPCGYHSLDKDGTIVTINDTELSWLGYDRSEVAGNMKFTDLVDEEGKELFREKFPAFKKRGSIKDMRFNMVDKAGTVFPVSLNSRAIYDEAGNYISSRSTVNDISDQVQIENELKKAKQEADQSAQVKEQFLANMSHEIRTPANAVIGFTNLLRKTELNREQQQYVTQIQTAGDNLLNIINDILDISKIEAGMLRIENHPFSLRGLCSSVETMFLHQAKDKKLSLRLQIEDAIPDTLTGDPVRLTQILVNLISNALKFTREGSIHINVSLLSLNDSHTKIQFIVKDTGIGIAPEKLDQIFERFEQGEADTTRNYGGTGLGLSIVKNLVTLQGGNIQVSSVKDHGTTFTFVLEYGLLNYDNNAIIKNKVAGPEEAVDISIFKNKCVLIVEDNRMNQLLVEYIFNNWQLEFRIAENGEDAIEKLQRGKFDLILLDVQMPLMDGYATIRAIRQQLKIDTPVIAMTAHALAGEKEKCLNHGMNDYISKPINEKDLFRLLKKYIQNGDRENNNAIDTEEKHIDHDFLQELTMGNRQFMKDLALQFLKQFPGEMENLQQAVEQQDHAAIRTISHHMQSTVSVLGRQMLFFQLLEKLENQAGQKSDTATIQETFNTLVNLKPALLEEVNRLLPE